MATKKQPPTAEAKKEESKETPFEVFIRFGGSGSQSTNNLLEALCKKTGL